MKKISLTLIIVLFVGLFSFGQKKGYWSESNYSSGFDFSKKYAAAILPVAYTETEEPGGNSITDIAYNQIALKLSGIPKLQVLNKEMVMGAVNTYRFGGGPVNASNYPDICKTTGAQLLVYCTLSRDKTIIKKKEVSTLMAWIQVFDSESGFTAIYTCRARSVNPLSEQAETEGAVRKALETFVTLFK